MKLQQLLFFGALSLTQTQVSSADPSSEMTLFDFCNRLETQITAEYEPLEDPTAFLGNARAGDPYETLAHVWEFDQGKNLLQRYFFIENDDNFVITKTRKDSINIDYFIRTDKSTKKVYFAELVADTFDLDSYRETLKTFATDFGCYKGKKI